MQKDLDKIKIGIDISLNSTGVFIENGNKRKFLCFPTNTTEKKLFKSVASAYGVFKDLSQEEFETVILTREATKLNKKEKKVHTLLETTKLRDAKRNSQIIIDKIKEEVGEKKSVKIGMEGFSYGSSGKSLIDLVGLSYLIRERIIDAGFDLSIVTPSSLKKFAGKEIERKTGGDNKLQMLDHFVELNCGDEGIKNSGFWKLIHEDKESVLRKGKILKPVDDLVDAYFLSQILD